MLGLRQGASENATVVGELLEDLVKRGVDLSVPMLYVLDGAKALRKAVHKHAGAAALIQRCQLDKRRNVSGHLPEEYRAGMERQMANAYAMASYADAKKALDALHRELMDLNPSAARSAQARPAETTNSGEPLVSTEIRTSSPQRNRLRSLLPGTPRGP